MTSTSAKAPIEVQQARAILLTQEERTMLVSGIEKRIERGGLVSFQDASHVTGLHPVLLRKLVRDGVLYGSAPYRGIGVLGNCDMDEARDIAARLQAARRAVERNPITISAAAAKYGFHITSIYNWQDRQWVEVLGRNEEGYQVVNEGDVAFARALADLVGHKAGKALLPAKE